MNRLNWEVEIEETHNSGVPGLVFFASLSPLTKGPLVADGNVCRVFFSYSPKAFCLATKSLSEPSFPKRRSSQQCVYGGDCWSRCCLWLHKRGKPHRIEFHLGVQLWRLRGWGRGRELRLMKMRMALGNILVCVYDSKFVFQY